MKILLTANKKKETYINAVEAVGAEAVVKYLPDDSVDYDGLILCGGNDLQPCYYGEEINGSLDFDEERDRTEMALVQKFFQTGKPILGICRGMQLLNVALGGTLYQNISGHRGEILHTVKAEKGSLLEKLYGKEFTVNSFHHQAIKRLGNGLKATLYDGTGAVIEGVEHESKPYLGVQWHPERICLDLAREGAVDGLKVIEYFIRLCEEYKNQ
jgi:putative glutamine amidotransferase